jgi:hypothetical protein
VLDCPLALFSVGGIVLYGCVFSELGPADQD